MITMMSIGITLSYEKAGINTSGVKMAIMLVNTLFIFLRISKVKTTIPKVIEIKKIVEKSRGLALLIPNSKPIITVSKSAIKEMLIELIIANLLEGGNANKVLATIAKMNRVIVINGPSQMFSISSTPIIYGVNLDRKFITYNDRRKFTITITATTDNLLPWVICSFLIIKYHPTTPLITIW